MSDARVKHLLKGRTPVQSTLYSLEEGDVGASRHIKRHKVSIHALPSRRQLPDDASSFTGARACGHAKLDGADLRDADLEGANVFGASRKTAKLGAGVRGLLDVDPGEQEPAERWPGFSWLSKWRSLHYA